ncbi:MAG: 3-deoxy-D-manno-octulosonic acid transferase [Nitrospinae bacterium]|nr:3-deoxy-D-manno-octulosonic acid transferase [Nitrospinota bacterium]
MTAYTIYNIGLLASLPLAAPYIGWRLLTRPEYRQDFFQRLGFRTPVSGKRCIWIHAVSVGETLAAEPLIRLLSEKAPHIPITLTVSTPTGRKVAEEKLASMARILWFPYDFPGSARRAVSAINPSALVMIDTEIWPNVIKEVKAHGGKVALVNGRISDRSYPRYKKARWLLKSALARMDLFLMQGEEDARRLKDLGAGDAKVSVAGNLKFDKPHQPLDGRGRDELKMSLGLNRMEKVIFLGSIHQGEEAAIRAAFSAAERAGGARVVIAPRRVDDLGWIERSIPAEYRLARRSQGKPAESPGVINVPVIDTFGELSRLYAVADVAFVGGSFISRGGQNPLEPAAHGVPVVFGPNMGNFRDAAAILLNSGGAHVAATEDEIIAKFVNLLADEAARAEAGRNAQKAVEANRGAVGKAVDAILELVK